MRSSRAVIAAALTSLVLVPALAACSSGDAPSGSATTAAATPQANTAAYAGQKALNKPDDLKILDAITVTGDDPAVTPKVTFPTLPVSVGSTAVRSLKDGTGDESVEGDKVTVRQALFLGKDGKQLQSDFEAKDTPSFILTGTDTIPGLLTALTGVKAGQRVLFAIPPAEAFGTTGNTAAGIGATDNLVVVADIVSVGKVLKQAEGAAVAPVEGQPTVTFDPTAGPTITVPKTAAPTTLVVQNLIDGTGPEIKSGQTITVHYTGVLWTDGTVFDSSWTRKSPATFGIGTGNVIPGWDKGLVGKKVGSRVLLVVPPADGYGAQAQGKIPANATLVFVVDILDAS
ncbi:MAG TPA: FKBP-type peptidyl-prolyl cis-trans isomerase [Lapillicoccus sp.]|nr:FKBP-type peptidyl-prolyl cis-trans isomerase [Lapillicoccus sp.]